MNHKAGIEVYVAGLTKKYVTLTGNVCESYGFGDRTKELQILHKLRISTLVPVRDGQGGEKYPVFFLPADDGSKQILIARKQSDVPVLKAFCTTCKPKKRRRFPQKPHPPRRAHGTLQTQDESVISGFITLPHAEPQRGVSEANRRKAAALRPEMKCFPEKLLVLHNLKSGGKCLWQEATVLIVPTQEI